VGVVAGTLAAAPLGGVVAFPTHLWDALASGEFGGQVDVSASESVSSQQLHKEVYSPAEGGCYHGLVHVKVHVLGLEV